MKYSLLTILTILSILLASCQMFNDNTSGAADKVVISWADAYFNYDYKKALKYMTPESEKWIQFAASNITEEDVEFIRQQVNAAKAEIKEQHITESDTIGAMVISVSNYVQLGTIGKGNQVIDNGEFYIPLVKRDGQWKIRMEALPRNERQSRD